MSGHRTVAFIIGVALGSTLLAQNAIAAANYYLKIDGIKGESQDDQHKDSMEIRDFSFSVETPRDAASGTATGKRQHKTIVIRKVVDSASPKLFQACASGQHFPRAVIEQTAHGGRTETITLQDVFISSVQKGPGGEQMPIETITLNFATSSIQYANAAEGNMGRMQTAPMERPQLAQPQPH